jgi:predicted RNase H-like HicB family nuclease
MKYLIILEKTGTGVSAYSPDLPGCVATGGDEDEAERNMREAVVFHLEGMKEDGLDIPAPTSRTAWVDIPA